MTDKFINFEKSPEVEVGVDNQIEAKHEITSEKKVEKLASKSVASKQISPDKGQVASQVKRVINDPQVKRIENVLADGLEEYYKKLKPIDQKKFKDSGEQAAREVNTLLQKVAVRVNEIIAVIKKWLSSVPGLNKFFVEQSAKIKADKILIIHRKH